MYVGMSASVMNYSNSINKKLKSLKCIPVRPPPPTSHNLLIMVSR